MRRSPRRAVRAMRSSSRSAQARRVCSGRVSAGRRRIGLEPGGELGEGEGLDDVVVGAGAQAGDALVDGAHRGQEDRRGLDAGGADRLQEREAVEVGEHPVEDQHVEAAVEGVHQALAAGAGRLDGVAGLAQALGEVVAGLGVVLDDEDAAGHEGQIRLGIRASSRRGRPAFERTHACCW